MSDQNDRTISEAARAQAGNRVANPFQMGAAGATTGGALVSIEQQKGIAEVQARMIIARANPRDPMRAMQNILNDCTREKLAEGALYQYARGGSAISGPSIRLAEVLSQRWGNIACGVKEISRDGGYSECVAYAWDLETGFFDEKQFQVRHWRDTKQGGHPITDERELYELVANLGARRKRACLLTVIPGDVVEAAVEQCELTLKTSADTSPEALKRIADAFAAFGVTQEQLEKRCQCRLEAIRAAQVVQLRKIYASLKDGMSAPADWFEGGASSAAAVIAAADAKAKPAATKDTPIASTDAPPSGAGDRRDARSDVSDAAPSPGKDQPAPEVTQQDRSVVQQVQQQRQADPVPETGAWFPTDDIGEPVEIPGGAEAFTSATEFAGWLCAAMDVTTRPDALWENNLDHVEELKAKWPDLFAEIDGRYRAADKRVTKAQADALAAEHARDAQERALSGAAAEQAGPQPLKVPQTQAGKASWPQYASLCRKQLDTLKTLEAVTEWAGVNFPTYHEKAIEPAIDKHIRETRARIAPDKTPVHETVDTPPAQPATEVDPDVKRCDEYLAEIEKFKTLDEARTWANRGDVTALRRRFATDKPDLAKLIKDAGEAKWITLGGPTS